MTLHVYSATGNVVGLLLYQKVSPQDLHRYFKNPIEQILVSDTKHRITIYNRDGSTADHCGNGLRALAHHLKRKKIIFYVNGRAHTAQRLDNQYWISIGAPVSPIRKKHFEYIPYHEVSLGNQHLIFDKKWVDHIQLLHPPFSKHFNLSFIDITPKQIEIETFERGCGWTEACGSASAAAVYVASREYPTIKSWTAINTGGVIQMAFTAEGIIQTGQVKKLYTL